MPILAANVTDDTSELLKEMVQVGALRRCSLQNKLNLKDKTVMIRFALINLSRHLPSNEEVAEYKTALLKPGEFDEFWKEQLEEELVQ